MDSRGASTSRTNTRARITTLFDEWAQTDKARTKHGLKSFADAPVAALIDCKVYHDFAEWITVEYVTDAKKPLKPPTLEGYFGALVGEAREKANRDRTARQEAAVDAFFRCNSSDASFPQVRWYRGVKANMRRKSVSRLAQMAEKLDRSAIPLGFKNFRNLSRAYARLGDDDAAQKKCLLTALWLSAGRTCEAVYLSYEALRWDEERTLFEIEIVQFKTSKPKLIPLVAGKSHDCCFFTNLGDMLATNRVGTYRPHQEGLWLFPDFQSKESGVGTAVGRIIKDMNAREDDARDDYLEHARWAQVDLSQGVTGAGVRPGACTKLYEAMPWEHAIGISGHEMSGFTKLIEYIDLNRTCALNGAVVLAGWPGPDYGKSTSGARPASVEALRQAGVDMALVEDMVDQLFYLDNTRPPMLLREGAKKEGSHVNVNGVEGQLRPGVRAAFASLVMYYEERNDKKNQLMMSVQRRLRSVVESAYLPTEPGKDPHARLVRWGAAIRERFRLENAHLHARREQATVDALTASVQDLGQTVGILQSTVRALLEQNAALVEEVRRTREEVTGEVRGMKRSLDDARESSPRQRARMATPGDEDAGVGAIAGDAHELRSIYAGTPPSPENRSAEANGLATAMDEPVPNATVTTALVRTGAHEGNAPRAGKRMSMFEEYRLFMASGCALDDKYKPYRNPSEDHALRIGLSFFDAMATDAEKKSLRNTANNEEWHDGSRVKLCEDIGALVRQWWDILYRGQGVQASSAKASKRGAVGKAMGIRWVENIRKGFKSAMKEKERKARARGETTGEEKSFDVDPAEWGVPKWREAWEKRREEAERKKTHAFYPPVGLPVRESVEQETQQQPQNPLTQWVVRGARALSAAVSPTRAA